MSSLAAARADNFYFPPDDAYKLRTQHPLRERAKKLDQGILVIRFEMPFNVFCACGKLIGKGVRFNAEKQQVGSYFSTKIWNFGMKAPCCGERIEVQTDPKNHEYVIVRGARRKEESYTAEDAGTFELPDREQSGRPADVLERLEAATEDRRRGLEGAERIAKLLKDAEAKFSDDYTMNKALRRRLRAVRKDVKARDERRAALGLPEHVQLLPASAADAQAAALVAFGAGGNGFERSQRHRRREIMTASIFAAPALGAAPALAERLGSSLGSEEAAASAAAATRPTHVGAGRLGSGSGSGAAAQEQVRGAANGGAEVAGAADRGVDARVRVGAAGAAGLPPRPGSRRLANTTATPNRGSSRPPLGLAGGVSKPQAAPKQRGLAVKSALALQRARMSGVRLAFSSPA